MAKISLDSVQFAEPISTAVILEGRKMRQIAFYNNDFDEVYLKPSGLNPDEYWDMMAENWNESRWEIDVCAYLSLLMNQYVEPI